MDEFALIDIIVEAMGDRAQGEWVHLGPGDDAAVITTTPGFDQVASIDVLVPNVHFPAQAPAFLIGYRALMVSLSDLAAMGAAPRRTERPPRPIRALGAHLLQRRRACKGRG